MRISRIWTWLVAAWRRKFGIETRAEGKPEPLAEIAPTPARSPADDEAPSPVAETTAEVVGPQASAEVSDRPTSREVSPRRASALAKPEPRETFGEFYFRESILDQLESYMQYIRRMKKCDPEAYGLYSQIGAFLSPRETLTEGKQTSLRWRQVMPSFGAIAFGISPDIEREEDKEKWFYPRFAYFTKYKRPPACIELANSGALYKLTLYWDKLSDARMRHGGFAFDVPVAVYDDGSVRTLRTRISEQQVIHHKRGCDAGTTTTIRRERWGIQPHLIEWARDLKRDPQQHLSELFVLMVNRYQALSSSMVRVSAMKGRLTAVFAVDVTRTPYFFADRDATLDQNGRKQRIFHITRAHERQTASGKSVGVRMHFRGVRRFKWNGYDVLISVPGWHHPDPAEFNAGAYDSEWVMDDPSMVGQAELGAVIASTIGTVDRAGAALH